MSRSLVWAETGIFRPENHSVDHERVLIDNRLVRIHFIIVMIRWTGPVPWEFEFPFPGSLTSTFPEVDYEGLATPKWGRGVLKCAPSKALQGYLAHKKTHPPRTLQ